jgi:hypothetical protein
MTDWIDEFIDALDELLDSIDDTWVRRRERRRARQPEHERDMTWGQRIKHKLGWYP